MFCRVCGKNNFSVVLDLKNQPWGNHFLKKEELHQEPFYPLKLVYCHSCKTSQLDFTVPKETMFSSHTYLSGTTQTLKNHFQSVATEVDQKFFAKNSSKSILDIGSNDGTLLKCFQKLGYDVLGFESSEKIAKIANDAGIPTIPSFFNLESATKVGKSFDVIHASGVFFHLEELHSVTTAIKKFLNPDGVFVVQFIYMKSILDHVAFDQIYHEHLLYYTLKTLQKLLEQYDLELFDAHLSPIHGGSIIGFVSHKGKKPFSERLVSLEKEEENSLCNEFVSYQKFARQVATLKEKNLSFLEQCASQKKVVYGMGAPVKGNTLLNYFQIGPEKIPYLVEKNKLRKNLYSPGMHIPILIEEELQKLPDVYYVLAWNFKEEILKNHKKYIDDGKLEFYFPIDPA